MRRSTIALTVVALALVVGSAHATRWEAGGYLLAASPRGTFAQVTDAGVGLQAYGVGNVDREGWLGVRLDCGFVNYGRTSYATPLTTSIPVRVRVNTTNDIGMIGIGPQLSVPRGPVRPYLYGTVGMGLFFTSTSVTDFGDGDEIASDMPQSCATLAYSGGAGLRVPVSRVILLDLGAEYRRHGDARYLVEGGIGQEPDGTIVVHELRSEANLLLYRVGVTYSFTR